MNGATIWSRSTIESEIFFYKPDKWFKIWFYLVSRVNHKDSKLFKRGEALITYQEIMEATKSTREQVRKCLRWMETEHMIEHRKTTRGMVRIVKKYSTYQNIEFYKNTEKNTSRTPAEHRETSSIVEEWNNERIITKSNSQNNFVEGVQQKFGNQFTNIGLEIFEETFGFKPIDLKPRNEAYTFYRSVQALLKRYNINITEAPERYKKLLTGYFTWLSDDDIGAGIQTMSGARRHFRKYEPKIINILERKNGLQEKTN